MPGGICAGQGWESEAKIDLSAYHRAKTGALFIAATQMGAIAAGRRPSRGKSWARASARRFRSPTICATRFMTRRRWASPPVRTSSTAAPMRWPTGRAGAIRRLEDILGGRHRLDPVLPGRGGAGARWCARQAERLTPVAPGAHRPA